MSKQAQCDTTAVPNTLTIRSARTGEPEVIENPLRAEHVKSGTLIWYHGFTTTDFWDCPAIITKVHMDERSFRVRSLDDMREQDQCYTFDLEESSPYSRQTMRVASEEKVEEYLKGQGSMVDLVRKFS